MMKAFVTLTLKLVFFAIAWMGLAGTAWAQLFSCNTLYGSYAGSGSSTFEIANISPTSATRTNRITTPFPMPASRGNAAALTPDGRYYFYRRETDNALLAYDAQTNSILNTGQTLATNHFRMGIEPTGTFGYVSRQTSFQRFLVAPPYTVTTMTVTEQGAPAGLEYNDRAGGDIAFDSNGFGYSVARRGGGGAGQFDNFLYRLEFAPSSTNVTATFLGQITSSNASFVDFDLNGIAFLNGAVYLGGGANAAGGDAQLWTLNINTLQSTLVGTDALGSNNIPITDLASCEFPTILLPANLSVTKTNGTNTLIAGQTTSYTITFSNAGPFAVYGAKAADSPSSGLQNCSVSSCAGTGGAICPGVLSPLLPPASALFLPLLPANSTLTLSVTCGVSATGL